MTRHRLTWLLIALGAVATVGPACGGDDDGDGTGGKDGGGAGRGGSSVTGGASGTGGSGGSSGKGGKGGTAGKDGGTAKDSGPARIPCGETSCNPQSMTTPLCDTVNGRCVECLSGANCPFTNRTACNPATLTCVQCIDDTTCTTTAPHCDPSANTCRVCITNAHCTPPNECIVMGTTSSCQLRCSSDADCATAPMNNRACNVATRMCVQCQTNAHCAGNANGPVCVGTTCRQCNADSDCRTPGLPACIANTCVACRDITHCAEPTPICVQSGANMNTCQHCANNAECASKPGLPACVANVCRQCSGTLPCPPGNTCTMNNCVPVPEAGPPEAGREGGGSEGGGSEGGAETGTDAPVSTDAPADG